MVYAFRCFAAAADENGIIDTLELQPMRILSMYEIQKFHIDISTNKKIRYIVFLHPESIFKSIKKICRKKEI